MGTNYQWIKPNGETRHIGKCSGRAGHTCAFIWAMEPDYFARLTDEDGVVSEYGEEMKISEFRIKVLGECASWETDLIGEIFS